MFLRQAREAVGLTQAQLAYRTGLNQNTISLYERGEGSPNLDEILSIETALNTQIDWPDQYQDQRIVIVRAIHDLAQRFPMLTVLNLAVKILSNRTDKNPAKKLAFIASQNRTETEPLGRPGLK